MLTQPNASQNPSSAVTSEHRARVRWRVSTVEVLPAFRLNVRFADGIEGIVDMNALVHSQGAGVFAALADPKLFGQATIEYGVVTWPGEIDLAPDAMYAAIQANGKWVLT